MLRMTVLLSLLSCASVFAQETRVLSRARNTYANEGCEKTDSCSLLRVSFLKEDYEVLVQGEPNLGTRLIAEYETESIEDLEKYVFVQFIRGCAYSTIEQAGMIVPSYRIVYGRGGPIFNFPLWRVDTYDDDPVYSSKKPHGRHGLTRWSELDGSFQTERSHFYFSQKPLRPVLYIQDYPSPAFILHKNAQNVSLGFRTCLYRSEDVPEAVDVDQPIDEEPMVCYEWESYFVYNHTNGEYAWPRRGRDICPSKPFIEE